MELEGRRPWDGHPVLPGPHEGAAGCPARIIESLESSGRGPVHLSPTLGPRAPGQWKPAPPCSQMGGGLGQDKT